MAFRRNPPSRALALSVVAVAGLWAACGDAGTEPPEPIPANLAPVVTAAISAQTLEVGDSARIDLGTYFSDPDGDALVFSAASSNGAVANAFATGSVLTVAGRAPGIAEISVTARDPQGLAVAQGFSVTVASSNRAPTVVATISAHVLELGEEVQVNLATHFSDPDGDALSYAAMSSNASVARVAVTGSVLAVDAAAEGTATVTVTAADPEGLTASTTFDVTVEAPNRAPVAKGTIPPQILGLGGLVQIGLAAYFEDPDGDMLHYTPASSNGAVARVAVTARVLAVSGAGDGTATVTVTAADPEGLTATQSFVVTVEAPNRAPVPVGSVPAQTLAPNGRVEIGLTAYFSDPDGDALNYVAASSRASVASVVVTGNVLAITGVGVGAATVTVTALDPEGLSATQTFGVEVRATHSNRAPETVGTIQPQQAASGSTLGWALAPLFRDPDGDPLTYTVKSSNAAVATARIRADSLIVSTLSPGRTTVAVTASDPAGATATLAFEVTVAQGTAVVTIQPGDTTLTALRETVRLIARLTDSGGDTVAGAGFAWSSSNASVASVDANGLVTAVANGTVVVTATAGGASGTAAIVVSQVAASVTVRPSSTTFRALGDTLRLTARARDRNGHTVAGAQFAWSSDNPRVAVVDSYGLVTALANGTAEIRATTGRVSGTASVTVARGARVVTIQPGDTTLTALGETVRLTARLTNAAGQTVTGATFAWSSSNPSVAPVDANGLVTAVANGTAAITATADGTSGTATVLVLQRPSSVTIAPASVVFGALSDTLLTARATDRNGNTVAIRRFAWSSGNASVASVDANGLVTAIANGTAVVTAAVADNVSGTAIITVEQTAAGLQLVAGADQRGQAGTVLPETITVVVTDAGGSPVAGAAVTFEPTAGHGSADPRSTVSDAAGRASTTWTLGTTVGTQRLVVTAGALSTEVSAEASASLPLVGFTESAGSAPEGGSISLDVTVSPAPSSALNVRYELVADDDPATADADEADYTNAREGTIRFASGTSSATIGIEIRDDADAEPPREFFSVRLAASAAEYNLGTSSFVVEIEEGVCDRTSEVADAILSTIGKSDCVAATDHDLGGMVTLHLSSYWSRRNITSLKAGDFSGLSTLRDLYLQHDPAGKRSGQTGLTELPARVFSGLVGLERLWMDTHSLTAVSGDVLVDLPNLEFLSMHSNNFQEVPANMFAGLSNLGRLSLSNNPIATLHDDAFNGLRNLRALGLRSTQLTELPTTVFSDLTSLWHLDLAESRLSRLPGGVLAGLTNLEILELEENQLEELPSQLFAGSANLGQVNLSGNELAALPDGILAGLSRLETLDLSGNPGAPFEFTLQLARIDTSDRLAPGPATVAIAVAKGAPSPVSVALLVSNGSASARELSVPTGATTGQRTNVVRASGSSQPAYLGLGPAPTAPTGLGYVFRTGEPLVLFAETQNRAPSAIGEIPGQILQAREQQGSLDIQSYFSDPDEDQLIYAATSESTFFNVGTSGSQVTLTPLQAGEGTLILTATDPGGSFASQHASVVVLPTPDPNAFNIDVVFVGLRSDRMDRLIRESAQRWMNVLTGDLPDMPLPGLTRCLAGDDQYQFHGSVDDILIFVGIEDSRGGGEGTPCRLRDDSYLPYVAGIKINPHPALDNQDDLVREVASHEFGHALGFISTLWHQKGFLQNPTWSHGLGADTHFNGPLAIEAFDAAGGTDYTRSKVPVENNFSVNSHWKTSFGSSDAIQTGVFQNELMSGFGGPSLSAVTVQSFADLGYEVDVTNADPYTLYDGATGTTAAATTSGQGVDGGDLVDLDLGNDVPPGRLAVADRNGNIVRIIRR